MLFDLAAKAEIRKKQRSCLKMNHAVFPRTGDTQTVYLKKVITNPNIQVGEYTIYNDFVNDPVLFEKIVSVSGQPW